MIIIFHSSKYSPIIYKGYSISKTIHGYRVTKLSDSLDRHTHLESFKMCYFVIDSVTSKKLQYKSSKWIINSLIRLSDDEEYINKLKGVLQVRQQKGKKQNYFNPIKKK